MNAKSRKGTAMVEASIVFPLVICAVVALIYITVNLYLSLSFQTSLHMALRNECGEQTETVCRPAAEPKDYTYHDERYGLRLAILGEDAHEYRMEGLFKKRTYRTETGRAYLLDEAELLRIANGIKEVL